MKSVRGLIALFLSYMIFHGWAVVIFILGTITANGYLIGLGTAVMLFWFGPGTPVIPLIIVTALFMKRYLLLDKKHRVNLREKWKELNQKMSDN